MGVIPVPLARNTAGPATNPAEAAAIFAVLGTAASGPENTPQIIRRDTDPATLHTAGPLVEACKAISGYSRQATVAVRLIEDEPGAYGTIDLSAFLGTALPAADDTVVPYNSHEVYIVFPEGTSSVGTAGASYKWSADGGRTLSGRISLGTATSIMLAALNVKIDLGPPAAQVTAFIAAVVEARADTLAHLADVVAHDAADTSAEQIALAASSPPTTGDEAWAVMNLVAAAYFSHRTNITVHNGPDPVNVVSHAAATDVHSGIDLYLEYRTDYNAHLGIALAAAAAGLRVATATVASPVTLTSADLLDPGEALLAVYPRRLTFTTGGLTPADAPADVDIVGTGYDDAPLSETLALSQIAGAVTSVNAYKTITSLDFPSADGTDATIAIGYGMGVHNSADVTNTLTATAPSHGTILANDVIQIPTTAPTYDAAAIAAGMAALATYTATVFGGVAVAGAFPPVAWGNMVTGLDDLREAQRPVVAVLETRLPTDLETPTTYRLALEAEWADTEDERIYVCAGGGRYYPPEIKQLDYQSERTALVPLVARLARLDYGTSPGLVDPTVAAPGLKPSSFGGKLDGYRVHDSAGNLVGHDERINPGLRDAGFGVVTSLPLEDPSSAFVWEPLTRAPDGSTAPHISQQRVVNVVEQLIYLHGTRLVQTLALLEPGRVTIRSGIADQIDNKIENEVRNVVQGRMSSFEFEVDREADISGTPTSVPFTANLQTGRYISELPGTLNVNQGV